MTDQPSKQGEKFLIYQGYDGSLKIDMPFDGETVWLSQTQIAAIFGTTRENIVQHIKNIYQDGELELEQTCKKILQVAENGRRYNVLHYNLDLIVSVGYRVNSVVATRFRQWATQTLREYMTKGFVMDDKRLADGGANTFAARGYFDELLTRVRAIRSSEKMFYEKVKEIFSATSYDYVSGSSEAKEFYATVQNKFHYAATGNTAAEIVTNRIDAKKPNAGLTSFSGQAPTRADAEVAKNYLLEDELKRLYLICEQFLSFAELKVHTKQTMTMADWRKKLDGMLRLNDLQVLQDKGGVSRTAMESKVKKELAKYRTRNQVATTTAAPHNTA